MLSKKNVLAVFLQLIIATGMVAQNNPPWWDNFNKYWWYRYRLQNDFMLIGDCQGCSIPAERRGPMWESQTSGDVLSFWADETSNLGYYIGVLATEYNLLQSSYVDVSKTKEELYYALKAVNRLDENAEYYYRLPPPPAANYSDPPVPASDGSDLNGFFIRSDIKGDFISNTLEHPKNWEHFNSGKTSSNFVVNHCRTSLTKDNFENDLPNVESMDQVINLMIGLSLAAEYVTDSYNGMDLSQEAKNITHRLIMHMKNSSPFGWVVKNPVTDDRVNLGADAWPYSYGFAQAACNIVKDPSDFFTAIEPFACGKYNDAMTVADFPLFQTMKDFIYCPQGNSWLNNITLFGHHFEGAVPCSGCQELYKAEALAAIGHSYYSCYPNCYNPDLTINNTNLFLSTQASSTKVEILPLLHQVLHGTGNHISDNTYKSMLNSAPCVGPYNFGNCNYGDWEWSAPVRWRQPEERGGGCPGHESDDPCHSNFFGEYNGLDYMLLFNLFSMAKNSESDLNDHYLPFDVNLINRVITTNFPWVTGGNILTGNHTYGNHMWPWYDRSFSTLAYSGHISANTANPSKSGDVTFRAGEEIALLPGFGVEAGADFGAVVQPFHCSDNDYIRFVKGGNQDTTKHYYSLQDVQYYASAHNTPNQFILPTQTAFGTKPQSNVIVKPEFTITPNPSDGMFLLSLPGDNLQGASEVFVYNDMGQLVFQSAISNSQIAIDLSAYSKGIYFVKVQSIDSEGASKIYTKKVVVQ